MEENALATPDASSLSSLNAQIAEANKKITAIQNEIDSLTE